MTVPVYTTSFEVSPEAARFFGIDPSRLMPLKARRAYRKRLARAHQVARAVRKLVRGRHDRCLRQVLAEPR